MPEMESPIHRRPTPAPTRRWEENSVFVLGCVLIAVAVLWFLRKLYISFTSAGGTDFEMPIYDAALYPPVIGVVGLFLVLRTYEIQWSWLAYVGIGVALILVAIGILKLAEELGDRPLR